MKKLRVTVEHIVPHWNFCNCDNLDIGCEIKKPRCQFYCKTRGEHRCILYDESLHVEDELIYKTHSCRVATASGSGTVEERVEQRPQVEPKTLIKQTVELYSKTVNDLINQGYPRPIAEATAKKYILGN